MKQVLIKIAIAVCMAIVLAGFFINAEEDALCGRALLLQQDVDGGTLVSIRVQFTSGEYKNTAVATSILERSIRTDVNKSRVAGAVIGNKSKEIAKGLFDGIRSKSKHSND